MKIGSPTFENIGLDTKNLPYIVIKTEVVRIFYSGHKRRASWIFRRLRRTSDQMYHD